VVHAGSVEAIFEAVLAGDPAGIDAIAARTPGAAAQRMDRDIFVAELPHMLYRGDTPLHLAAAGLRYGAARALLAAGATMADADGNGVAVADRIQGRTLRNALAAGQLSGWPSARPGGQPG